RRANVRQSQSHVGCFAVRNHFHGYQSLIVVWSNHRVEFSGMRTEVDAVCGIRSEYADPFGRALLYRGRQDVEIFTPEHSAFSGMRIHTGHRNARTRKLESFQLRVNKADQLDIL